MNALVSSRNRDGAFARFLERAGVYLLFGPPAALLGKVLLFSLFGKLPADLAAWRTFAGLTLLMLYVVALPVAGLYATIMTATLALAKRAAFFQVAASSLLVSLVLYFPALVLAQPSDPGEVGSGGYLRVFIFVFVPVLTAGFVCWLVAPNLRRAVQ